MRWFRRLFRRRPPPPAPDLAPIDRLAEVVERVVALLEERRAQEERRPRAVLEPPPVRPGEAGVEPARHPPPASSSVPAERRREPPPAPPSEPTPLRAVPAGLADTHLLFAGGPAGYRLFDRPGPAPQPGDRLGLDGAVYGVVRLGPSPLPGDRRRCAFVELEQPRPAAAAGAAA